MALTADGIAKAFSASRPATGADYDIIEPATGLGCGYLAFSRSGSPALLIPLEATPASSVRVTRGLALRSASSIELANAEERRVTAAAIIECRDVSLLRSFTGMIAAIVGRLRRLSRPTWGSVSSTFTEWERLFAVRRRLSADAEIGLWGELWCVAASAIPDVIVSAWRGPDDSRFDFFLDDSAFEVKTSRLRCIHHISQAQTESVGETDRGFLVSVHVGLDPVRGRTLPELVSSIQPLLSDAMKFEETLATVGFSRDDEPAYQQRVVLLEPPIVFSREAVPRVRDADSGVTQLRYRVELDPERALDERGTQEAFRSLGIDLRDRTFPCS